MITALDHIVLVCPDIDQGTETYRTLLGTNPVWQSDAEGSKNAIFSLSNTNLELIAPSGRGQVAEKLSEMVANGPKLTSLVYRSDDIIEDHRLLGRRGLSPTEISEQSTKHRKTGDQRAWHRFRLPDEKMAGIKSFVLEPISQTMPSASLQAGSVTSLDHIVIETPNPDRAAAIYGARLGLRFALDRTAEQWKTRFLFFRLGGLTLEIIHRLDKDHDPAGNDLIWGITWAVENLEAAHDRLSRQNIDVSKVRTGRKPGSRVFTAREGTLGIPTLFIQHDKS
ncbi:MAG: VOC family protein [Pseudomonadota bacterium]